MKVKIDTLSNKAPTSVDGRDTEVDSVGRSVLEASGHSRTVVAPCNPAQQYLSSRAEPMDTPGVEERATRDNEGVRPPQTPPYTDGARSASRSLTSLRVRVGGQAPASAENRLTAESKEWLHRMCINDRIYTECVKT